jgi:hypothetical protein
MIKIIHSPFKVQHTDGNKIALHTRVNCQHRPGNDENSGGSCGVSAAGLFENKAQFRLFENRAELMPLSL